jgi:hypothetical protein
MREDVSEFSGLLVTFLHDSGVNSKVSKYFAITGAVASAVILVASLGNSWIYRHEVVPSETAFSIALAACGTVVFIVLLFGTGISFWTEALASAFSCLCRAMVLWLIVRLVVPDSTRAVVVITFLSSAMAAVEISETAVLYAPATDLSKLQLPLAVAYDAAVLGACIWAHLAAHQKAKYRLSIYTIIAALMAAASTFIALRLGDSEAIPMRSSLYLMKRAVMFAFLAAAASFHAVVEVQQVQKGDATE